MPQTDGDQWWLKPLGLSGFAPDHPVRVASRAYSLALALSLGPALIPFLTRPLRPGDRKHDLKALVQLVKKELSYDGFAFAMTTAVAGGPVLRAAWSKLTTHSNHPDQPSLTGPRPCDIPDAKVLCDRARIVVPSLHPDSQQGLFLSNVAASWIGFILLRSSQKRNQGNGQSSRDLRAFPMLDFTLLLVVRALDAALQGIIQTYHSKSTASPSPAPEVNMDEANGVCVAPPSTKANALRVLSTQVDAFLFWACSSRIMWCYFYEPRRLPRSYVKWINKLANLDGRVVETLQLIRNKKWTYSVGSKCHSAVLQQFSADLGYPAQWGDPAKLPSYGGKVADAAWKQLGIETRSGVGGIPCELVHAHVGRSLGLESSCHANATLRFMKAFVQALAIYLPVHFVPILLTNPNSLLQLSRIIQTGTSALRSTAFLSSFVGLYWYTVCFTRSWFLAKLLPCVSHQFWDGPYGAMLAGSLACGTSIWVENGRRRGEMALYVLPRALRTCLPQSFSARGFKAAKLTEGAAFVLSLSFLLQTAINHPDTLRGLSRWTLNWVLNGKASRKGDTGPERIARALDKIIPQPQVIVTPE